MPTRTAIIPTEGLPPRPVRTDWRWLWPDESVLAAKSAWTRIARRIWTDIQIRYPDRFDAVSIEPIVIRPDGPDEILGVKIKAAVYPDVSEFKHFDPQQHDAFITYVAWGTQQLHQAARRGRWALLTPLPVVCERQLWWHPSARIAMMKRAPSIELGPGMYAQRD